MINANELRIGNWVINKENEPVYQEVEIDDFHALGIYKDYFEKLFPITLTPEILEKAGFEKGRDYWTCKEVCISSRYNLMTAMGEYTASFYEMQYLHQLQNLYFALTGEELEINNL